MTQLNVVEIKKKPSPILFDAMPISGPLVDRFGRVHSDLRLSVTDRCNLRCIYCMPEEGLECLPRENILRFEEIATLAQACFDLGIDTVRLTGGEPLVRKGIENLIKLLDDIGFKDIALTTNGILLPKVANLLKEAGLKRINLSLDSLNEERFSSIRRRGELKLVLNAIETSLKVGFNPVKVNCVVMSGVNDDEILDILEFGRKKGVIIRFIEFMPVDASGLFKPALQLSAEGILNRISERYDFVKVGDAKDAEPAERFRFLDVDLEFGVIGSMSRSFCSTCNRLRLTADGAFRNCLFATDEVTFREMLRNGASQKDLEMMIRRTVWGKRRDHGSDDGNVERPNRSMSMVGG